MRGEEQFERGDEHAGRRGWPDRDIPGYGHPRQQDADGPRPRDAARRRSRTTSHSPPSSRSPKRTTRASPCWPSSAERRATPFSAPPPDGSRIPRRELPCLPKTFAAWLRSGSRIASPRRRFWRPDTVFSLRGLSPATSRAERRGCGAGPQRPSAPWSSRSSSAICRV